MSIRDRQNPAPRLRVPPPKDLRHAERFRSTWLASSIKALKDRDLWDTYLESLPTEFHEMVVHQVAGLWLPLEVAHAHYAAADSLGLSESELYDIGREVTDRVHGTLLSVVVRSAKAVGASPWMVFDRMPRMWDRVWEGGGVVIREHGPKEAQMQLVAWPIADYNYIRFAMRGVVTSLIELFCRKVFVREESNLCRRDVLSFRVSWV